MIADTRILLLQNMWNGMLRPVDLKTSEMSGSKLPTSVVEFISRVGLPPSQALFQYWRLLMVAVQPYGLDLIRDDHIWKQVPVFELDKLRSESVDGESYIRIGNWGDAGIGLHADTAEVALIAEGKSFYLNASLDTYIYALGAYLNCEYDQLHNVITEMLLTGYKVNPEITTFYKSTPRNRIISRYNKLIDDLTADDPTILEKSDSCWLMDIEMAKRGL